MQHDSLSSFPVAPSFSAIVHSTCLPPENHHARNRFACAPSVYSDRRSSRGLELHDKATKALQTLGSTYVHGRRGPFTAFSPATRSSSSRGSIARGEACCRSGPDRIHEIR